MQQHPVEMGLPPQGNQFGAYDGDFPRYAGKGGSLHLANYSSSTNTARSKGSLPKGSGLPVNFQMEFSKFEELLKRLDTNLQADLRRVDTGHQPWHITETDEYLMQAQRQLKWLSEKIQLYDTQNPDSNALYNRLVQLQDELQVMGQYRASLNQFPDGGVQMSKFQQNFSGQQSFTCPQCNVQPGLGGQQHQFSGCEEHVVVRNSQVVQEQFQNLGLSQASGKGKHYNGVSAVSSQEAAGHLRSIKDLLSWVNSKEDHLSRMVCASDMNSVESQQKNFQTMQTAIAGLGSQVDRANELESNMPPEMRDEYCDLLLKLNSKYHNLLESSGRHIQHMKDLRSFMMQATEELKWLNLREEKELVFDWSDRNTNMSAKRDAHAELQKDLERKEADIDRIQKLGEQLLKDHPAAETIEAYMQTLQTQWSWMLQLVRCIDIHLRENTNYFQFFKDAQEVDKYLMSQQEAIKMKYVCDKSTNLDKLDILLKSAMAERDALADYNRTVLNLMNRAKTVVQLKPRDPQNPVQALIPLTALCEYKTEQVTVYPNDQCLLKNNSHRTRWRVVAPGGGEITAPSVCLLVSPLNKEAMDIAGCIDQVYQDNFSLWQHVITNMKCLIIWQCLLRDMERVRTWSASKGSREEYIRLLHMLEINYDEFLKLSEDSQQFSVDDLARLKREYSNCAKIVQQGGAGGGAGGGSGQDTVVDGTIKRTETNMTNTQPGRSGSNSTLDSNDGQQSVTSQLDGIESILVRIIRTPLKQPEPLEDSEDRLDRVKNVRHKLESVSSQGLSPDTAGKLKTLQGLSVKCLDHYKVIDMMVRGVLEVESNIKVYEQNLAKGDLVLSSPEGVNAHIMQLKQWLLEIQQKQRLVLRMQDEVQKAQVANAELYKIYNLQYPDVDIYTDKGTGLIERWKNMQTHINTRLQSLGNVQKILEDYKVQHRFLTEWYGDATRQLQRAQAIKGDDHEEIKSIIAQLKKLQDKLGKDEQKVKDYKLCCDNFTDAMKHYEPLLLQYRDLIRKFHAVLPDYEIRGALDDFCQEQIDMQTCLHNLMRRITEYIACIESWHRTERRVRILVDGEEMPLFQAYAKGFITREKYDQLMNWQSKSNN